MANPFSYKNLLFPLGGLDRKTAYQSQPPYTTMDALNVRPYRMESRRMAGGSRPGLAQWAPTSIGGKVNMLALARGAMLRRRGTSGGVADSAVDSTLPLANTVSDDFLGNALKSSWSALDGCDLPFVDNNPPNAKYANPVAAVYRSIAAVDAEQRMEARMILGSIPMVNNYGSYTLCLGMDNDSPSSSGGLAATVTISENGVTFDVKLNGTSVYSGTPNNTGDSIRIRIEGNGDWTASYGSTVMAGGTSASIPGQRFGFKLEANGEGSVCAIDYIEYTYRIDLEEYASSDESFGEVYLDNFAEFPVAAAEGKVWRPSLDVDGNCDGWTCINGDSGDLEIQHVGYVMAQQRLRELFIADCGNDGYKAGGADGTIAVSNSTATLTATGVSDWTELGIVAENDVVLVSDGATGIAEGEYIIASVASGGITLEGYTGSGGTCSWQVSVSTKVLKLDDGGLEVFQATAGSVPVNCPLICLYRDRLVMAGNPSEPHLWYMSRQGDPYDWNYVEDVNSDGTDYGIAVAGANADAGIIGQPIRALMPHSDDYLVFGYDTQLWILRGDPAAGGQLDCISRSVGVVGKRAWCHGPHGEIFFLSHNGLHSLAAGGNSQPQMISYPRLPVELTEYTYTDNIQMSYDKGALGIHIFIEGESRGWFFSIENESFWPVEFASGADVSAMCEYGNKVLIGCTDGYVRVHDDECVLDDNKPFASHVLIGPVRLGRDDYGRGVLQKLDATMCGSMDAEGLQLSFVLGDEPIEAAKAYESGEYELKVDLRKPVATLITRRGSGCFFVKIGQTVEAQGVHPSWWGMERLGAYIKATGRFRE